MGLNKPVHILDVESSIRDIVNMTAIAVLDAIVEEIKINSDTKIEL
jgi:malate dehydrogenase (oxaloacetate-decarboxylating)(NADP+)